MRSFLLARWLRSLVQSKVKTIVRKPSRALCLEELEDRVTPATFIWTGGGPDTNWSDALNWQGGTTAPTGAGDDLSFPAGALQLTSNNDLTGAVINSITFGGNGYNITGNPITLGTAAASGSVIANNGASNDTVALNMTLAGAIDFFSLYTGSSVTVTGTLSGTAELDKTNLGTGTLTLSADNSGFSGPVSIDPSAGILAVTASGALGTGSGASDPVTVGQNSQLQLNTTGTALAPDLFTNYLILNGAGTSSNGALLNVAGVNTWAGNVELDNNVTFGATAGSVNITGSILNQGGAANVTKEGAGTVIFSGSNTYGGTTTVNNGVLEIQNPTGLGSGADDLADTGVTVNSNINETGTLEINDPAGVGFTISNKLLTLNGQGFGGQGALVGGSGANTWAGNVILGSPAPNGSNVQISVDLKDSLTIAGVPARPSVPRPSPLPTSPTT